LGILADEGVGEVHADICCICLVSRLSQSPTG